MSQRTVESARALILSGRFDEAEALLRKSQDAWSRLHLADLILLRAPFDRERVEEACGLYEEASKDFPDLARASVERARAMLAAAPDPLVETLRETFGFGSFRPGQRDVIEALRRGRHVLAVMPPGSGKSLLFELASQVLPGTTVVVTPRPLRTTVDAMRADPSWSPEETRARVEAARLAVVPPARLTALAGAKIALLAVDEAHAASDWSPEFRPEYAPLREAILALRPGTLLAVTPSATTKVRAEIVERLGLQNPVVHVSTFDRPNVFLTVLRPADRTGALASAVRETPGPCIVHVHHRTDFAEVLSALRNAGIPATESAEEWTAGKARVLAAAPGADGTRPDVRAVFHHRYPRSIEELYRQAARAGRDGQPAKCVVFFDPEDKSIHRTGLDVEFPSREVMSYVFGMVKEGRTQAEILSFGGGSAAQMHQRSLDLLEQHGCIRRTEPGRYEVVPEAPPIQRLDLSDVERRRRQVEERLRAVEGYLEGRACRRRAILEYFGENLPSSWSCSGCDRCRPAVAEETTRRTPEARQTVLDSVRELEARRMTLNQMARAILFLGRPLKGLTETDVREILHSLVREGAVELNPQGQWLKVKRR